MMTLTMTTTTTQAQDRSKVHKKVFFNSPNVVHQDTSEPPSPAEKDAVWYNSAEIMQMKQDIFVAVQSKNKNQAIRHFNWRGLEQYANNTYEREQTRRQEFTSEFLLLQHELQCVDMEEQEDPLALFAADQTRHDRKVALKLAKQDELDAKKVYKSSKMLKWPRGPLEKETNRSFSFMASLVQGFRPSGMQFKVASSA